MPKNTVKIRHLIGSQLASYIKDEFPLIDEFFSQYYNGLDFQGGTLDLINNIDSYLKLSENANTVSQSELAADITDTQDFIDLYNADGFPEQLGIVEIDDEIIVYQVRVGNRLLFCQRGFTGVSSFDRSNDSEELTFSETSADSHTFQTPVKIIRPFNCFGPRQSLRAVIPTIISQALFSNKINSFGFSFKVASNDKYCELLITLFLYK